MAIEKTAHTGQRGRRRGLALLVLGLLLSLAALARGGFILWRPVPDTWDAPELWIDAALIVLGLIAGALGWWIHHRALTSGRGTPATFFTASEEQRVVSAIHDFESTTSGEIRVHLHGEPVTDMMAAATATFERLGMTATRDRNGVLFFVAVPDRRFAVLGDAGIHARVPEGFWDGIRHEIEQRFAKGDFAGGLVHGIEQAGRALAQHFPPREDDVNELPDDISRT